MDFLKSGSFRDEGGGTKGSSRFDTLILERKSKNGRLNSIKSNGWDIQVIQSPYNKTGSILDQRPQIFFHCLQNVNMD